MSHPMQLVQPVQTFYLIVLHMASDAWWLLRDLRDWEKTSKSKIERTVYKSEIDGRT